MANFTRNFENKDAYIESYNSLRAVKNLRCMVKALDSVIGSSVKRMEKELLPVSLHRGIRSLPREVMVDIMTRVGEQVNDPKAFKEKM